MNRLILTILCALLLAGPAWGAELTAVKDVPREYVTKLSDADVRVKLTDKPRIEASKWAGEAYLHLTYEAMDVSLTTASLTDKVVSSKVGGQTIRTWALGDDVLEMSVTFATLADVPKAIELTIQDSGNLDYFYQPELTADEFKEGCYRPPNVVGSYAVYHKSKANNQYKTGKFSHLFRWEAIGADGKRRWLDPLKVEKGKFIIGVPDLSEMAFPVVCMGAGDTIGWTAVGGTSNAGALNRQFASGSYIVGTGFDATGVTIYGFANPAVSITLGIFSNSSGKPLNILADTAGGNCAIAAAWVTQSLDASYSIQAGVSYWVGYNAGGNFTYYYDEMAGMGAWEGLAYNAGTLVNYSAFPSTMTRRLSIYAGSDSGGAPPAAAPPRRRGQVMIMSGIPDPPKPWWNRLRDWLTPPAWALRRTE